MGGNASIGCSEIIVLQATVWGVFSTGIDDVSYLLLGTILLLRYL